MATIFNPGGATNTDRAFRQYGRDNFNIASDPSGYDVNGFPKNEASPGPTPPPLKGLITVVIDPAWYAQNGHNWMSPLADKLPITYLDLNDGISEQAGVDYADTPVIGRAEVYKTYMGTQNREVTLLFQFRAQGLSDGDISKTCQKEVIDPAKWLDALKYPVIVNDLNISPPPVILVLGDLLAMRCVATSVSIKWGPTFDPGTLLPLAADVEVTFTAVHSSLGGYEFGRSARFETFQPPSNLMAGDLQSRGNLS